MGKLNLIKLCVGAEAVDDLIHWQSQTRACGPDGHPRHVTRMWPKRAEELLDGGSIYWVFKGLILCRQPILRLDQVDRGDGIARCGIVLGQPVTRVTPTPKRPFQGWRYLTVTDAPKDLGAARQEDAALPPQLERALAEIGVV
ncbi:MAG: DUF1489 domain-containing protein [Pseudomonadota bacterium]